MTYYCGVRSVTWKNIITIDHVAAILFLFLAKNVDAKVKEDAIRHLIADLQDKIRNKNADLEQMVKALAGELRALRETDLPLTVEKLQELLTRWIDHFEKHLELIRSVVKR